MGRLNATGQVVNEYEYNPWGVATVIAEGVPQPLRYAAREWDATVGLYQVRARWYDPHTGRFVSEDPIGLAGGINGYVYAANNPINATDPYGLCTLWETVVISVYPDGSRSERVVDTYWKGPGCSDGGGGGGGAARHDCTKVTSEKCPIKLPAVVVRPGAGPSPYRRIRCDRLACSAVEAHYNRNDYNMEAPSLDAALNRRGPWNRKPWWQSIYHRYGPGNERNMKFVSDDGHHESIFRPDGTAVRDCTNGATYNYGTNLVSHFFYDMVPYYLMGNCP
jgi:RHS repeat-associated protein